LGESRQTTTALLRVSFTLDDAGDGAQAHRAGELASEGPGIRARFQQYLGAQEHPRTRYTELSPERFKNFWRD
jgi:hypothetical protein